MTIIKLCRALAIVTLTVGALAAPTGVQAVGQGENGPEDGNKFVFTTDLGDDYAGGVGRFTDTAFGDDADKWSVCDRDADGHNATLFVQKLEGSPARWTTKARLWATGEGDCSANPSHNVRIGTTWRMRVCRQLPGQVAVTNCNTKTIKE